MDLIGESKALIQPGPFSISVQENHDVGPGRDRLRQAPAPQTQQMHTTSPPSPSAYLLHMKPMELVCNALEFRAICISARCCHCPSSLLTRGKPAGKLAGREARCSSLLLQRQATSQHDFLSCPSHACPSWEQAGKTKLWEGEKELSLSFSGHSAKCGQP